MATPRVTRVRFGRSPTVLRIGLAAHPLSDLHHYLLRSSWPKLLAVIVSIYVATNALFGALYWLDGGVENAHGYLDFFFFSVHTMMTIGYGSMVPTSLTSHAIVSVQALVGLIGTALTTGLFFGKFSLPTSRVMFSKHALIRTMDGGPCLIFRMANERTTQVVEAALNVVLTRDEHTAEGDTMRRLHGLRLVRDRNPMFSLTWTAIHRIDADSPLYQETAESLKAKRVFLIASLVGIDETSSATIHARWTYGPDDLVWGGKFVDILSRLPDGNSVVDYTKFHEVEPDPTRPA